ncbi:glycosyltransferase family 4 protein [Leptolyngbya ohadii]|uniref:glycosyltransferase family 4 protein n=1 Tax=Leptolyngbya ohadii TaxID=1962290 RepID=UPI000B59D300|nr:glycosyltransferase family 4 protein [Leptolyngbya ohadii]
MSSGMSAERLRVLVLAFQCNPDWPSLPILAHRMVKTISQHVDVTVVTPHYNQPNIERVGIGNAKVVYFNQNKWQVPLARISTFLRGGNQVAWTTQMAMDYPAYVLFEQEVWQQFGRQIRQGEFDLIHRITPMTTTIPSPIASRSPIPFLMGPLNSGLPWMPEYRAELVREREWMTYLRGASRLMPFYQSTYRKGTAFLTAHAHTRNDIPKAAQERAIDFPETGYDPQQFFPVDRSGRERKTILFAGRLVPYKLPEVVVRAFAASPILREHRLVIVGDGPERPRLEEMVAAAGIQEAVEFHQSMPYLEFPRMMQEADIFAFPSIRELGGGVIIEAMASGLPCVVIDYGGPSVFVNSDRGVKVQPGSVDELVDRYQRELEGLVTNPDRMIQLGQAAHQHVLEYYAWEAKGYKLLEIYRWLAGLEETKPDYWQSDNSMPIPV